MTLATSSHHPVLLWWSSQRRKSRIFINFNRPSVSTRDEHSFALDLVLVFALALGMDVKTDTRLKIQSGLSKCSSRGLVPKWKKNCRQPGSAIHLNNINVKKSCWLNKLFRFGSENAEELTLLGPAYLRVSKDQRGGAYLPPYEFWVWFGLGFRFFLEMTCLGVIYHIQKDSWSLDDQNPPKNDWLL